MHSKESFKKSVQEFLMQRHINLRSKQLKKFINDVRTLGKRNNLTKLAKIYGTDKWGTHFYTTHYQHHFKQFKNKKIVLFEVGVGGHENPEVGGNSLRMWKRYFSKGQIFSIDIFDKSSLIENRIHIFKGSQTDSNFLKKIIQQSGNPDIIIDDGSHVNEHVIETFKILFPLLREGGIYVVEDTQTSYWPEFGGDSTDLANRKTILNFFKQLTDCLNYEEFRIPDYEPSYYDKNILAVHFYHNIIFIYKGNNDEPSNKKKAHKIHN